MWQCVLGVCHSWGVGGAVQDDDEATAWLRLAADQVCANCAALCVSSNEDELVSFAP